MKGASSLLDFKKIPFEGKTSIYAIHSIFNGSYLGTIKWYPPWRRYCFFPETKTLFDVACLNEIVGFTRELMEMRKMQNAPIK